MDTSLSLIDFNTYSHYIIQCSIEFIIYVQFIYSYSNGR